MAGGGKDQRRMVFDIRGRRKNVVKVVYAALAILMGASLILVAGPGINFGSLFGGNITLTGGPAPVRAYVETLLPAVLDGTVQPGKVFDRTVTLDEVPDGYRAMAAREALKVLVRP